MQRIYLKKNIRPSNPLDLLFCYVLFFLRQKIKPRAPSQNHIWICSEKICSLEGGKKPNPLCWNVYFLTALLNIDGAFFKSWVDDEPKELHSPSRSMICMEISIPCSLFNCSVEMNVFLWWEEEGVHHQSPAAWSDVNHGINLHCSDESSISSQVSVTDTELITGMNLSSLKVFQTVSRLEFCNGCRYALMHG